MSDILYLDHAATSWPKPEEVREETLRALTEPLANAGRSGHSLALRSARLLFETREELARLFGVARSENLLFTRGCTESLNLVLKGYLKGSDRVAVSPMEHNSVMRPLERLSAERGIVVDTMPADRLGRIDVDRARRMAGENEYALVVVSHASNVNGVVQDLAGVRRAFGGTPILVDAAQTAGVLPVDLEGERIDFFAFSIHKGLLGPTGVGGCYISPDRDVTPLLEGGTGSRSESYEHPSFRPDCFEAGTLNLHGIAGTLGALRGLAGRGLLGDHERTLSKILADGLSLIPDVRIHSPLDGTALCVSFTVDHLSPDRIAHRLEREYGILSRPGVQCAPAAHRHLGTLPAGTVRFSPGWANGADQMEAAVRAVHEILKSS
jgi:cysteine desulfurase / selenocysteine lyase